METLRVIINARPLLPDESAHAARPCITLSQTPPSITLHRSNTISTFSQFDAVYDQHTSQTLYHTHITPLITSLYDGINATIFAYGQTAAGKSFTMSNVTTSAARQIFTLANTARARGRVVTVRIGFVEIYKEVIRDLVDGARAPLGAVSVNVRERVTKMGKTVFLDGARERSVGDEEELLSIIREGALVRRTAATGMNASSSRSHSVITITVQQEGPDGCLAGKLHLVDLAGSERAKRTQVTGERFAEGVDINRGLFALAKVISSLAANASGAKRHVPYRDSKLTRLLQDSLGGNSRTLLIACVSPADTSREETLGTLRYAERAKSIKNNPKVNTEPDAVEISDLRAALARAKGEISRLVAENEGLRRGRATVVIPDSSAMPSLGNSDAMIVTRGDGDVTGLRYRIRQLEGMLADRDSGVGRSSVGLAGIGGGNVKRRERRARRRTRPPQRAPIRKMGSRSASASVLPRVRQETELEEEEDMNNPKGGGTEMSDCIEGLDGRVAEVISATRLDAMRTTFTERLRQAEVDKRTIDAERIKLLRQITAAENKHVREMEDLKTAHSHRIHELKSRLADSKRADAEISRQIRLREVTEASHKKMADRVAGLEKAREDVVSRLADAVLREEQVRRRMGKENRELAKNEKALRGELRRLELVRGRLEAAVRRLKVENEGLKSRLRDSARGMRRANSAFVRSHAR